MMKKVSLYEIFKLFLTIGTIGFGEGMAIIALMQEYVVARKQWLSNEEFSHGITLGQFLGPFSVNATIFVGYRLRGITGAFISVLAFLFPSFVIVVILSMLYYKYHSLPSLQSALHGIEPVVIALILAAAFRIGKNKFTSAEPIIIMLTTVILSLVFKIQVFAILIGALFYGLIKTKFFDKERNDEI